MAFSYAEYYKKFRCSKCTRNFLWAQNDKCSLNGWTLCVPCFEEMSPRAPHDSTLLREKWTDFCYCEYEESDYCCSSCSGPYLEYEEEDLKLIKKCEICEEKDSRPTNT